MGWGTHGWFALDIDGTDIKRITPDFPENDDLEWNYVIRHAAAWSADGERLAYWAYLTDWSVDSGQRIERGLYVLDTAAGSAPQLVLEHDYPYGNGSVSWSPDGTRIAYHSSPDSSISILDVGSGETNFFVRGEMPDWSPDGRKIVYTSNHSYGQYDQSNIFIKSVD